MLHAIFSLFRRNQRKRKPKSTNQGPITTGRLSSDQPEHDDTAIGLVIPNPLPSQPTPDDAAAILLDIPFKLSESKSLSDALAIVFKALEKVLSAAEVRICPL